MTIKLYSLSKALYLLHNINKGGKSGLVTRQIRPGKLVTGRIFHFSSGKFYSRDYHSQSQIDDSPKPFSLLTLPLWTLISGSHPILSIHYFKYYYYWWSYSHVPAPGSLEGIKALVWLIRQTKLEDGQGLGEGKQCPTLCVYSKDRGKGGDSISPKLAISSQRIIKTDGYLALFEGLICPNVFLRTLKKQKNNKMMYNFGHILLLGYKMI